MKTLKNYYGDCEGPFGYPMTSEAAKVVEGVLKDLPEDCKELLDVGPLRMVKIATAQDFTEGERADTSFIVTETVDRDSEVMLTGGGDWKEFKKNPLVTFAHNYHELPPGKCLWLRKAERNGQPGWMAKTQYIERPAVWEGPWQPDAIWHYIKTGNLPGKSIGFIPLEVRSPTPDEIVKRPELAKAKRLIVRWLALEYAVAPIPANPDALVTATAKAKSLGIDVADSILDELGIIIPNTVEKLEEHVPDPVTARTMTGLRRALTESFKTINVASIVRETIDAVRGRV